MKSVTYGCMAITVIMLLTACGGTADIGEPPPDAVCRAIVNDKCTKCHYKTRICAALGSKSVRDWRKTIGYMLKQGAQLTKDERNKVIACLSSLPNGSSVVCE